MATRILLDTDIGTDIDDALALAYLLAQPQCELLGVTTVTGEPEKRAMLASAICKVAGRSIPIYPGTANPLLILQMQRVAQQAAALGAWPHDTVFPRGEAIEFMRRTIRAHPGEVTLLTIGPLTNAALLLAIDPEIATLLKGLVMMCGAFGDNLPLGWSPEWNARGDAHASAIVYRTPVTTHRSLGLNVTQKVTMDAQEARRRLTAPLLRPVLDFAEIWFQQAKTITFHDPLAAVSLFDDRICTFERGRVTIDLSDGPTRGATGWTPSTDGSHEVAMTVDTARFFDHFFSVFA